MRSRAAAPVLSAAPYAAGSPPGWPPRMAATISFVAARPSRGDFAISVAHATAVSASVVAATTRFTRPMRSASVACSVRPVSSRSRPWPPPSTSSSRAMP